MNDGQTRRLFFGLRPDAGLRGTIRAAARPVLAGAQGRLVPVANYHLTLAFLGTVEPGQVPAIEQAAAAVDWAPFDLLFDRVGYWRRAGVLWLAPSDPPAALAALVDRLWDALESLGFSRDSRPYRPHLTLVNRLRRRPSTRPVEPFDWPVERFALFESCAVPDGVEYRVLQWFHTGSRAEP